MNDTLTLVLAWAAGGALGTIFFLGLWWTVRKGLSSQQPALWFLGSLLLRTSIVLAGFYFVSGGHWERLLMCLAGFVMGRLIVIRLTRPFAVTRFNGSEVDPLKRVTTNEEAAHAP